MSTQSAGHLIVESLKAHKVDRVFSVPGESYLDLLDGLHGSGIENVVCRQEGGAAYMAEAAGKATGRPGVALVTRGPGAANAFVGIHLAWQDSTPLVLFVGLIPFGHRGKEAFQEFDPHAWFGTQTKQVFVLDEAARASELVAQAFFAAASGRPGPVVVGIPEDILAQMVEAPVHPPIPVAEGAVSEEDLGALTAALEGAQRPAILVGGPRWTPEAAAGVTRFAEANRIPVLSDWRSADRLPWNSPVNAGELGYGSTAAANKVFAEADVLLLVGGTLSDVPTADFTLRQDPDAVNLLVNIDSSLRQHSGSMTRQILAAPAVFGRAVGDLLLGGHADWEDWTRAAAEDHARTTAIPENPGANRPGTANMTRVMAEVRRHLPADAAVTFGSGNHTAWAHWYFPSAVYPSQFSVRNGTMGYSVPAAVAVSLTFPGRFVLSVAGDGEFLMNGQELATALQYGAKALILVMDNGQYGTIRSHQEARYPGRVSGTQLANPDFAAIARGYGAFGALLDDDADIPAVIAEAVQAVQAGRPAVVHIKADRALTLPTAS